jgi:hypothetical protein
MVEAPGIEPAWSSNPNRAMSRDFPSKLVNFLALPPRRAVGVDRRESTRLDLVLGDIWETRGAENLHPAAAATSRIF